ncbi:Arm DNA-binding domain-containing protein [Domibacillus tundrae]|uniref:Arm DNA-binding domain-containing protein n=1 Tax=Domibacillus tundrae TaxID=1587527 RepID=UPI001FE01226|nr:Arm DNA-binding domain-containing protein [Domibacillus tundrae]
MALIKKDLSTGKYYFVLDAGRDSFSGKRNQYRRRGFETKKEAQIALAKLQVQISEEKEISLSRLHFQKYLEQWFNAKKIKLKPSTIQNYDQQIRYNIVPYIGDVRMSEFTESIIQTYIQTLHKERKLSPATIRAA